VGEPDASAPSAAPVSQADAGDGASTGVPPGRAEPERSGSHRRASSRGSRWADSLLAGALAVGAGALWGECFAVESRPLIALVALSPIFFLLLRPSARPFAEWRVRGAAQCLALGWLHGFATWLIAVPWIASVLHRYGDLPMWLAVLLLFALCAYLGAYHGAFALLARRLLASPRPLWLVLAAVPAVWVGLEWLRSVLITGFPWNLAAYAWVATPGALSASAWVGSFGISFLLVLTQVVWFQALRTRSWRPMLALLPVVAILGAGVMVTPPVEPAPGAGRVVRVVQPNIAIEDSGLGTLAKVLDLSRCPEVGGLVVWPESATHPRSWQGDAVLRSSVLEIAGEGCDVLLNTSRWEGEDAYNTALLVGAEGEIARYDKVHLVPFGEYVPLAGLFPFLDEIARNAGGYTAARELVTLAWREESLGVAICFEVTLPAQVARLVGRGATILVTLTNDAWYGDTSAPRQHFVSARFRAAENRRPLLRAAITGISAVVDPWGRPLDLLGVDQEGALERRVAGRSERTLYSRAPWAVPALCVVLALAVLAGGVPGNGKRNGEDSPPTAGASAPTG
jgi:apolipoprotein N-acyltransferase